MHWYFIPFHYQTIAPCTDGYSTWMDIVLSIHEWIDIWALLLFRYPEWATVNICVEICVCALWFLRAMSLGVELLGHMVITLLRNCQPVSRVAVAFYIPSAVREGAPLAASLPALVCVLTVATLLGMKDFLMDCTSVSYLIVMLNTCMSLLSISVPLYLPS